MTISLRHKLWLGFGGLLMVLLVVSGLSFVVFNRFSQTLERVFRENYDSVIYCREMREQLDLLDARAQRLIWEPGAVNQINPADCQTRFEQNLQLQFQNISLPTERRRTEQLATLWRNFKKPYAQLDTPGIDRAALYRQDLFPRLQEMKTAAQQIADINMNNMVSVNGQVKRTLIQVRTALLVLVIAGIVLATLVVWTAGAAMLRSLGALTRSARQIEAGDLELTLQVKSRDEIGLLAEAFNSMAARLREFRRSDLDRLSRTQQTTQLAIDSLPDAVFVIGPDQKVEIANRAAKTHFNIEPGATISALSLRWLTPLYESITLDHKPISPVGYSAALQLFDHGEERFLLPHAVPMLGPRLGKNDELIGVTVILVDVTTLYRTDEAKSSMLLTVSHELRTPLTSMRMAISLLGGSGFGPITPQQEMLIKTARDESNRLNRIIENLLNISRLEAGRAQLQFRPLTVAEIFATAIDPLRPGFAEKNISLRIDIAPEIGEVNADPIAMNSALTNLLSNAMKFTPIHGQVKITAGQTDAVVTIAVTDTGPGIPQQYRNRIFEKFFRVPNETGPTGAGLGLTIATEIIQAHGGQLTFHCPDTGGTVFSFSIPVIAKPPPAAGGRISP